MKYAKIIGTGSSVPETVLSNSDLENMVETSDHCITSRSGIKE
ncbi:MAG: 3-oxoacyl-ACP synthase, partial [Candidatus Dadabacteria bacterium]|nr:3-oxoacyl-ACP synthase [Candidatus Dadabacteria bacterium]